MNIIVTGATGFIGNTLVEKLLTMGFNVIPIGKKIKSWSLPYIKKNLVKIDLTKDPIPNLGSIDCACLLASKQPSASNDWNEYYKINSEQILRFIDKKIDQIIYISTSSVNLINNIPNPKNHYGLSKLVGERLLEINQTFFKQSTVIRFPSVMGYNHNAGIIHDLKLWIENRKEVDLFDKGKKLRNVIHVNDAVKSILLTINEYKNLNKFEVFNIGSKESNTLENISSSLIDLMNIKTKINLIDKSTKSQDVFIDNTKAISKLKYSPTTIRDGLKKYLKEYDYEV